MTQGVLLSRAGIRLGPMGSGWQGAERAEDGAQYDVFIPREARFLTSCPGAGGCGVCVYVCVCACACVCRASVCVCVYL